MFRYRKFNHVLSALKKPNSNSLTPLLLKIAYLSMIFIHQVMHTANRVYQQIAYSNKLTLQIMVLEE